MTWGRLALTGPSGRLGSAIRETLAASDRAVIAWGRPDYDLDDPTSAEALVSRDRPDLVIHTAAWTDVDGCAREPEVAWRRNALAAGELATACATAGCGLVLISTNEVFDGARTDGQGYVETDPTAPINAYGASKLAGEEAVTRAFRSAAAPLWVVRTAWLFGPPRPDFPAKIVAASDRLPPGEPLRVVADETGSPTSVADLALAALELVDRAPAGTYHLVNAGVATRAAWAEHVLARTGRDRPVEPISQRDFDRPSRPPAWGVLDAAKAGAHGVRLRPWTAAFDDYASTLIAPR